MRVHANVPVLHIAIDKGDVIKISFEKNGKRYYWIALAAHEEGLMQVKSDDLEITNIWEIDEDELPEAEV